MLCLSTYSIFCFNVFSSKQYVLLNPLVHILPSKANCRIAIVPARLYLPTILLTVSPIGSTTMCTWLLQTVIANTVCPSFSASLRIAVFIISHCPLFNFTFSFFSFLRFAFSSAGSPPKIVPFLTYPRLSPCSHVPYIVHVTIYPVNLAIFDMIKTVFWLCQRILQNLAPGIVRGQCGTANGVPVRIYYFQFTI